MADETFTQPPGGELEKATPAPSLVTAPPTETPPKTEPAAGEPPKGAPKEEPKAGEALDVSALKLPEGMKADDPQLKDFTALVSDPAISSKDRAQKLLDLYTSNVKAAAEANGKAWTDLTTKWVDEVKADKEIGGANLEKTQQTIAKALGQYGDPGLNEALAMTGAGNNPAIIRTLFKMAKALNEGGTPPTGNPPAGGPKDIASLMYPNHAKGN